MKAMMISPMMIQQQQLNNAFLNVVKSYLQCISDQLSKCFYLIKTGCCCCIRVAKCASLVLHCASLLRTIFASWARANERAHVQNVRNFPQTKLDSVISDRFLLNEHGDPHFLFYKFNENNTLNN